ncbi:hypothetical protein [Leucobacter triazinivorans]|uniref:Uncharacterized protein n=1 Tax=Leucobacter triazinivorans TaxID=1784719 RepID=A0A4P6KHM5_9MICO|nr:hypothetical protein [Leucobacter triazinivorans]QBE50045.1 hypothetical protein EVS81_15410 [Leucobacter triazinivorans]
MDTRSSSLARVNTRALLLPYALALIVSVSVLQAVIAVTGGEITLLSGVLVAAIALALGVWFWLNRRALRRIRFGGAIAHSVAFVTITTSMNLHVVLRTVSLAGGDDGFAAAAHLLLATPWFGATLIMSVAWGLGLLIHLIGAILGRGWED